MEGTVLSIEEFSVYDGPGIRTTVFLKGCPLHCSWCHNPEGQSPKPQILRSPNGCLECGSCERYADENGYTVKSMENCPRQLLRRSGDVWQAQALCQKLLKNKAVLNMGGGGITFSGGEPLMQGAFLLECLEILKGQLHTAVQTSGYGAKDVFARVLSLVDYVLFDLKIMDAQAHIFHTGVSNRIILDNFEALVQSGVPFVPRVPLIPGAVDTAENLTAIACHLQKHNVTYAELMPYNPMAGSKYKLAGREYKPTFDPQTPPAAAQEIFAAHGIGTKML